ncbi:MAG: EAL domain-containing protein [Rickettsiales bacterium]|nr:EAL domain-containing protein [Rickettsiales bacterium]
MSKPYLPDSDLPSPLAVKGVTVLGHRPHGYPEDFTQRLQEAITQSIQGPRASALILVGMENLPMIMAGYGPNVSEDVCRAMMELLMSRLTSDDVICRLHKDQFGIILTHAPSARQNEMTAHLNECIQQFGYQSEYGALHVLSAIVCIDLTNGLTHANEALDQGFIALRSQQGIIHPTAEYHQQESANSRQEMGLANYLSKAIREQRLRMAYQPIIESKTGRVAHYEALLRIVSHDGKISSAGTLIPVAERMGIINVIDELVLDRVIDELVRAPELVLAFNVSNLTTSNRHWLNLLKQKITAHPDVAERLIVEITETAVHRDLKKTAYFVAAVQSMGAQVALDDFGSGYTSFRQLKSLSVDMVKIDGVFVRDLVDNNDNRLFVKTMLDFTNGFGLKAVAEFVETGEIAKMLIELGVEYMQGYYFGKPENHRSWLKEG